MYYISYYYPMVYLDQLYTKPHWQPSVKNIIAILNCSSLLQLLHVACPFAHAKRALRPTGRARLRVKRVCNAYQCCSTYYSFIQLLSIKMEIFQSCRRTRASRANSGIQRISRVVCNNNIHPLNTPGP